MTKFHIIKTDQFNHTHDIFKVFNIIFKAAVYVTFCVKKFQSVSRTETIIISKIAILH